MSWTLRLSCFLFISTTYSLHGIQSLQRSISSTANWYGTDDVTATSTIQTTTAFQNRNLCQTSFTKINGKHSCKGKIIFQETFSSLSNKWRPEKRFAGDPDYEFTMYTDNKTNIFVNGSYLFIRPTLTEERYGTGYVTNPKGVDFGTECTGFQETLDCVQNPRAWLILPPVISAQISTINSFSFTYGIVEVKAKLPKGDWLYPEISLVPKYNNYGPGLESGRMRIAFSPGNENLNNNLWSGCTLGHPPTARNYGMRYMSFDTPMYNDFHVYKLQWKVDSIILYVDNEIYGTIYPPVNGFASEPSLEIDTFTTEKWQQGTILAPFDQEMYIVIGVGAGGLMFQETEEIKKPWINDDPKAQLRFYKEIKEWSKTWDSDSELIVDYVKVWAI